MWNCNEAAVKAMAKTNNTVEDGKSTVEAYITLTCSNFRFIEAVLREQVLTETK